MKKSLLIISLIVGLTVMVKAQWTVYDGSVLPDAATPSWTTGDVGTPPAAYSIVDGFENGNKILYETSSAGAEKMTYKLNGTRPVDGTWIIRTKAGANPSSMEFEFHAATGTSPDTAFRINMRLYPDPKGGFIKLNYAATGDNMYPADSSLDVKKWHTYRITVENARNFKIYLDENPTEVITCTGSTSSNSQIFRIGDIGSTFTQGAIDWMVWDFGGAYAPGAGTALPVELATGTPKGEIIFITGKIDNKDSSNIKFLQDEGYLVDTLAIPSLTLAGQDTIDLLNSADLIVVGWDFASSWFNAANGKDIWNNKITTPLLDIYPNVTRSNTCNWFKSSSAKHLTPPAYPDTIWSVVQKPLDPVFNGITLNADTIDWALSPLTYIQETNETNGEVLVKDPSLNALHFVRWNPGQKYYPGADATAWPAGPRTFFDFGNNSYKDNGVTQYNYWTLTEDTKAVYAAEIDRLINTYYEPYLGSDDATLSELTASVGTLTPAFSTSTYSYDLVLNTTTVEFTAVPNEAVATVMGDGIYDLSSVSDSAVAITVVSSSTNDTLKYIINVSITKPKIILISPLTNGDVNQYNFLVGNNMDVTQIFPGALGTYSHGIIDTLNMADLVIIGRAGSSSALGVNTDAGRAVVSDSITSPIIANSPFHFGSDRLRWFNSTGRTNVNGDGMKIGHSNYTDDPIFKYTTFTEDTIEWSYLPESHIFIRDPFNGDTIAYQQINDSTIAPLIARFTMDSAFYPGSTDTVRAPRTYFGFGNDQDARNYFPLTKDVQAAYLGEVLRLLGRPVFEPSYYVSDDASMKSLATLPADTLKPAFSPDVYEYTFILQRNYIGEDSLVVTATPNYSLATVTGNGVYKLTKDTTEISVYARAENTRKGETYLISVILVGEKTGIEEQDLPEDAISVFPNPVKDNLIVSGLGENFVIRIYNNAGQLMHQEKTSGERVLIDVHNYKNGTYIIQLELNGIQISKKFIKQ